MNGGTLTDAQTTSAPLSPSNEHAHPLLQAPGTARRAVGPAINGDSLANGTLDDERASEAETDIQTPVKKAVAAKQNAAARQRTAQMKTKEEDMQDGDLDAPGSPDGTEIKAVPADGPKPKMQPAVSDHGSSSDELSDVSEDNSDSSPSEHSRQPTNANLQSSNPRKRKHRASSVSLPNKRPSIDASRRRKRGATEDRFTVEPPDSPQNRTHRRAASVQSVQEGPESHSRKRRSVPLGRENSKSTRKAWDEESMSSEATSHGQQEQKRAQRGVGRATTASGRSSGKEAKVRHNKFGYTRLAEACEADELDDVKLWLEREPASLDIPEYAKNTPLQIAAINGHAAVVEYLITQGCNVNCENIELDTPLIDAAENGHADVVDLLLKAGVNPLRQNRKGQQALDVIDDETDNVSQIRASLRAAIERWGSGDAKPRNEEKEEDRYRVVLAKELHFMARTYENLLKLVALNDRNGVREFLDAMVPVDNNVIAAAAKTGDLYLVNMLLADLPEKKRYQKVEKPLLNVLGTSHFEMVKTLTELDQFNPRWRNRSDMTWAQIARAKAGPMWRQEVELLERLESEAKDGPNKSRSSSSPVARRTDMAKRNPSAQKSLDDSDGSDSETPRQRKNGRRLLSRKDMRAAGSKKRNQDSDGSATDDGSDIPQVKEKRGPGRPRTKSIIKSETGDGKDRRRSTSHKVVVQSSLSAVAEKPEAPPVKSKTFNAEKALPVKSHSPGNASTTGSNHIYSTEVTMHDASSVTQQEELDRQHAAEQKQAQKAMEARLQQEEAERFRKLEETRLEQQRREAEAEKAKQDAIRAIVTALPQHIAMLLDTTADFSFDERGAVATVLGYTAPIQAVMVGDLSKNHLDTIAQDQLLVLNLAIAPLLGKQRGAEILLSDEHFPTKDWPLTLKVLEDEHVFVHEMLRRKLITWFRNYSPDDDLLTDDRSAQFEAMLKWNADRYNATEAAHKQLLTTPMTLRWLPLQRILDFLHPSFHAMELSLREEWRDILRASLRPAPAEKSSSESADIFEAAVQTWTRLQTPKTCRYGRPVTLVPYTTSVQTLSLPVQTQQD